MLKKRIVALMLTLAMLLTLVPIGTAFAAEGEYPIVIKQAGKADVTLTPARIAEITKSGPYNYSTANSFGTISERENISGVTITDLFAKAGIDTSTLDAKKIVKLIASDGYEISLTWGQLIEKRYNYSGSTPVEVPALICFDNPIEDGEDDNPSLYLGQAYAKDVNNSAWAKMIATIEITDDLAAVAENATTSVDTKTLVSPGDKINILPARNTVAFFTTDGSEPNTDDAFFNGGRNANNPDPITVPANNGSGKFVIKTKAIAFGKTPSTTVTYAFSYKPVVVPATNISNVAVAAISNKAYTGKQIKPAVKVTLKGAAVSPANYTVSYGKNKEIGKATITLTGKGSLTGKKTINFKIVPKRIRVSKTVAGKRQLKVTYTKLSKARKITRYQIRYRVRGTSKWVTKTFKASAANATLKKLRKGKYYQIQVRSYKTVSRVKYYSAWSATKLSKKVK